MEIPDFGQLSLGLARGKLKSFEPSESQIEMAICHYLQSVAQRNPEFFFWKNPVRGYFSGKIQTDGRGRSVMVGRFRKDMNPFVGTGVPDIIVIYQGKFIGLEVKTPKNRQSESQIEFQRKCEKAQGKYFVVRSIEDVENVLKGI